MDNKIISQRLKEIRAAENINQEQFAEKINMSRESVQKWEQGKQNLTVDNAITIAKTFNVSLDYIFGNSDDPNDDASKVLTALNKYFDLHFNDNQQLTATISDVIVKYFANFGAAKKVKTSLPDEAYQVMIKGLTDNFRNEIKSADLNQKSEYILLTLDEFQEHKRYQVISAIDQAKR